MPKQVKKAAARPGTNGQAVRMTTGQAVVNALLAHGIDTVYALPGVHNDHFFDALYRAYSDTVIPPMGKLVTGDAQPYQYFIESIRKFPKPAEFDGMLGKAGFKRVKHTCMTGNIATLFSGWKI